jgi:xylulokinase
MAQLGKDLLLGYDVGTSSVKAALFDRSGRMLSSSSADYWVEFPAPGWAEQNPETWWTALCTATPRLFATPDLTPDRVAAIGIAAQMCGVVPVAADGEVLHNALIWLDTRSQPQARRIAAGRISIGGYSAFALARFLWLTGGAPNLSGKDPISKMMWLHEERPLLWEKTAKLLDAKDYLVYRCTGNFLTTPDCAHLTWLMKARGRTHRWSPSLMRLADIPAALLPPLVPSTAPAGPLTAAAAASLGLRAGTPVAAGMGDVSAFALAGGTRAPGALHLNIGTSGLVGAHIARSKVDPLTKVGSVVCADGEGYLLIAAQENAGVCVDWACRFLGFEHAGMPDFAAFERAALAAETSAAAPFFFPWLFGERVPVDDASLRAGFANLAPTTGRNELAYAVLEGVAFNIRWAVEAVDRLLHQHGTPMRVVGGGSRSDGWCQIIADVLQRPLHRMEEPRHGGARGAAMAASVAAGLHPDIEAALTMAREDRLFEPDRSLAQRSDQRFALFKAYHRRLAPWQRRVAATANAGDHAVNAKK